MTKRHTDTNTINGAANNDKCKMTNGLHNHHSILIDLSLVKISFVPTVRKRHLKYYISPILIGCCQIWIRFSKYKLSSFESNYAMKQPICNRLREKNQKRYMVAAVVFARTEVVSLVALTMNELTRWPLNCGLSHRKRGSSPLPGWLLGWGRGVAGRWQEAMRGLRCWFCFDDPDLIHFEAWNGWMVGGK